MPWVNSYPLFEEMMLLIHGLDDVECRQSYLWWSQSSAIGGWRRPSQIKGKTHDDQRATWPVCTTKTSFECSVSAWTWLLSAHEGYQQRAERVYPGFCRVQSVNPRWRMYKAEKRMSSVVSSLVVDDGVYLWMREQREKGRHPVQLQGERATKPDESGSLESFKSKLLWVTLFCSLVHWVCSTSATIG